MMKLVQAHLVVFEVQGDHLSIALALQVVNKCGPAARLNVKLLSVSEGKIGK